MELSERYIEILEKEGFPFVYEWTDTPNTAYKEHEHEDTVSLCITDGSIEMNVAGEVFVLSINQRYNYLLTRNIQLLLVPKDAVLL